MERQLDSTGGEYLKRKIESLGIRVMLPQADGGACSATAGGRPALRIGRRDGSRSGGDRRRHPAECGSGAQGGPRSAPRHRRQRLHGDVRSRYLRGRRMHGASRTNLRPGGAALRAGQGAGGGDHRQSADRRSRARRRRRSSRSWASTSSRPAIDESEPGVEIVRYEDPSLGIYKKLLLKDNRLHGVILVGDVATSTATWNGCATARISRRTAARFCFRRAMPIRAWKWPRCRTARPSAAATASRKGEIIEAIHAHGITTLAELKERTRASTSCGSCTGLVREAPARRGAGFRGRNANHAVLLRAVLLRTASRHHPRAEAQVRAGSAGHLRQPQGLRSLQAGAELHARHGVVRRSRGRPLGALHQRSRPRQYPEGRHVLRGAAHARRRDHARRTAPHRRRRRQVQRADGEGHRQPAHRPAGRQESRPAENLGRSRHALRPGLHQGRAHGEDLRRHGVLPLRRAGFDAAPASNWNGAWRICSRRTSSRWAWSAVRATAPRRR